LAVDWVVVVLRQALARGLPSLHLASIGNLAPTLAASLVLLF
jgi:hypothetical protein